MWSKLLESDKTELSQNSVELEPKHPKHRGEPGKLEKENAQFTAPNYSGKTDHRTAPTIKAVYCLRTLHHENFDG